MDKVYLLWHIHPVDEDEKLIGVFKTREDADAAVLKLRDKPGFKDTLVGFSVDEYHMNRTHWEDGFVYA